MQAGRADSFNSNHLLSNSDLKQSFSNVLLQYFHPRSVLEYESQSLSFTSSFQCPLQPLHSLLLHKIFVTPFPLVLLLHKRMAGVSENFQLVPRNT